MLWKPITCDMPHLELAIFNQKETKEVEKYD